MLVEILFLKITNKGYVPQGDLKYRTYTQHLTLGVSHVDVVMIYFYFYFYYLEKSSCVGLTPINGFHSPCKLCMNIDGDNSSESGMLHAHIYWCNLDYRKCNFGHFLVFKECFRYMQCFKLWDNFQNPIARLIAHNGLDILAWEFVGVLNYQNLSSSDLLEHISIPLIF